MKRLVKKLERMRVGYYCHCNHCKTDFEFGRRDFKKSSGNYMIWMCPDCGRYHAIPKLLMRFHKRGGMVEVLIEEEI